MSDWVGDLTVGLGWVYYSGPVGDTEFHQHYAVQICFPFSGPLHIETPTLIKNVDNILVIGSNVSHRLSCPSPTSQLLYLEPNFVRKNPTRLRMDGMAVLALSVLQLEQLKTALDTEVQTRESDFGNRIASIIWPDEVDSELFSALDPRIAETLEKIKNAENLNLRLSQMIGTSGLSASRFRHLFKAQVGMSLKSYLLWTKLQRAIQFIATNSSLTQAAHAAGFADSAHLSRTFRRTFGLAPADLNKNACFTTRN